MADITDSTTDISAPTSWTEQTIVSFNAGTLGNMGQCIQEVEAKLQRPLTTASRPSSIQVRNWLIFAKEQLLEIYDFSFKRRYAYCDTTASTYRYSLPQDYAGGKVILRDKTNDFRLEEMMPDKFDLRWPDPSEEDNGQPTVFTIKGMELWVCKPPTASIRLELEYNRSGDDNTPMDVTYLPELMRYKICQFALAEAFESLWDTKMATWYWQKWQAGMLVSKRADARKKWAVADRALSWVEREWARNKQS